MQHRLRVHLLSYLDHTLHTAHCIPSKLAADASSDPSPSLLPPAPPAAAVANGGPTASGATAAAPAPEPEKIEEIPREPPAGLSSLFDAKGQPCVPPGPLTARSAQQRELVEGVMAKIQPVK